MRKTKEDKEVTRKTILDAALELFSRKGYDTTTLEEVAENVKMTRGAVYWHFKNKEDLLNSLLDEYEEILLNKAQKVLQDKKIEKMSLSQRGLLWITIWVKTLFEERNLFRTRALYSIQYPERMSEKRRYTNEKLMQTVKEIFVPVLDEIRNPGKEKALNFVIMTIDTSSAYKIILEDMNDHLLKGITEKLLIREYHHLFESYLNCIPEEKVKIKKLKEGVKNENK